MSNKKGSSDIPYDERIATIMDFFGISKEAAVYIYHRKRRGYPFKKRGSPKFLEWTLKLQNALVKADECLGWDWDEVQFGSEEKALAQHDIYVDQQSDKEVFKHESNESEGNDADGWTEVKNVKREKYRYNKTLRLMGFISSKPKPGSKKKYHQKRKESETKNKD